MKVEDIILSSFVYSGSSRKAAILAAATNPINKELVTQLVRYLDKSYLKPKEEVVDKPDVPTDTPSKENLQPDLSSSPDGPAFSDSNYSGSLAAMFGDDVESPEGDFESPEPESESEPELEPESEPEPEPEVESSVNTSGSLENISASVASMLNAVDTTSGVRSAKILGNELWIYYKDNVNLNSVMESVIDAVATHELEFNRLARSHNAIVFTSVRG